MNINNAISAELRAELFDLFNHPTFGQPGYIVGSPIFGRITYTDVLTVESSSSRRVQFKSSLQGK